MIDDLTWVCGKLFLQAVKSIGVHFLKNDVV